VSWIFEEINPSHLTKQFRCNRNSQQTYIRNWALKNHQNHISKTTVAVSDDNPQVVVAFCTLNASQVEISDLSPEEQAILPAYPVPAIRICQLAVDKRYLRRKLATSLIYNAFQKIVGTLPFLGVYLIILDVEIDNQEAIDFYTYLGFDRLPNNQADQSHIVYALSIKDILGTLQETQE
jgi:ribosomal protein S18 acetylase RimI-like enzyme